VSPGTPATHPCCCCHQPELFLLAGPHGAGGADSPSVAAEGLLVAGCGGSAVNTERGGQPYLRVKDAKPLLLIPAPSAKTPLKEKGAVCRVGELLGPL